MQRLLDCEDPVQGYGFYDYALYAYGLALQGKGRSKLACSLYDLYLKRRVADTASAILDVDISRYGVTDPISLRSFERTRETVAQLQENIWQTWGRHRWVTQPFEAEQRGYEYYHVLTNRILACGWNGDIAELLSSESATSNGESVHLNRYVFHDQAMFWASIKRSMTQAAGAEKAVKELLDSNSFWPIDTKLLEAIRDGYADKMPFVRWQAALAMSTIAIVLSLLILIARRNSGKREPLVEGTFQIHRGDLLGMMALDWLRVSPVLIFLGALLTGAGLPIMAWSEDVLLPGSYVVDRAFLDYLSFPFGYGLLIPFAYAFAVIFYRTAPTAIRDVVRAVSGEETSNGAQRPFRRLQAFCTHPWMAVAALGVSIAAVLTQKWQWMHDPGTAFVDMTGPGSIISLTGVYSTLVAWFLYYTMIQLVIRAMGVLLYISTVFSVDRIRQWRGELRIDIMHPDRCNGLRNVGTMLGLFYFVLALLGAQLLLNMVEKLRFYESLGIVLQSTFLSVSLFGLAFVAIVPFAFGYPLLRVHVALKRYRTDRLESQSLRIAEYRRHIESCIQERTCTQDDIAALSHLNGVRAQIESMALWPVDTRGITYFLGSNIVPIAALLLPILIRVS